MKTEIALLSQLCINGSNPRIIKNEMFEKLVNSILVLPKMLEIRPIVVDDTMTALGGNMRLRALLSIADMKEEDIRQRLSECHDYQKKTETEQNRLVKYWLAWLDKPTVPIIKASELSDAEKREFIIKDNIAFGEWNWDELANEWDSQELDDWGLNVWQDPNWGGGGADGGVKDGGQANASLNDRFIVPPFSVLDTRKGYWEARKKQWRELIGDYGESRNDTLITSPEIKYKDLYQKTRKHREELGLSFAEYLEKYVPEDVKEREEQKVLSAGVSLFDPVLAEIMCRWFIPKEHSSIFDPFAGDTQKGFVFGTLGHRFTGIELRKEQVEINERVLKDKDIEVKYICDDGQNVAKYFTQGSQDLLFSCPPYYDLEIYSDLENDASNQDTYEDFIAILRRAYSEAIKCLSDNRFAVIVVGDIRNKKNGFYYDFVGDIKRIFADNGMYLYNEIILVETGASTALRAGRYMESRKVAKMHQNVLIFYKGKAKTIRAEFPKIEYTADDDALFKSEALGEAIEETTENHTDNADA